jgi:hypothetical protein
MTVLQICPLHLFQHPLLRHVHESSETDEQVSTVHTLHLFLLCKEFLGKQITHFLHMLPVILYNTNLGLTYLCCL